MSCAVVSVNRALGVLAAVWVLIPVAAVPRDAEPLTGGEEALPVVLDTELDEECRPSAEEQIISCQFEEAEALVPSL